VTDLDWVITLTISSNVITLLCLLCLIVLVRRRP
jgi:hypothetical protein